jgi:hypothetical protein
MEDRLAQEIDDLVKRCGASQQQHLFVKTTQTKAAALTAIGETLHALGLNILSVRRGGLQMMALSGVSTATLLAHSRHRTKEMLEHYLDSGRLALTAVRELFHIKPQMMAAFALVRGPDGGGLTAVAASTGKLEKALLGVKIYDSVLKATGEEAMPETTSEDGQDE